MKKEQYKNVIEQLLIEHEELGVNQLHIKTGIPLSTLQKYLDKEQRYFVKTPRRKWTLPNSAKDADAIKEVNNANTIFDAQLTTLSAMLNTFNMQFEAFDTFVRLNNIATDSREKIPEIDKRLRDFSERADETLSIFKEYSSKIPDSYLELLMNLDIIGLGLAKGTDWFNGPLSAEISGLIIGSIDQLDPEIEEAIKSYQKEK